MDPIKIEKELTELEKQIYKNISIELEKFHKKTGVLPENLKVHFTTNYGIPNKPYLFVQCSERGRGYDGESK